MAPKRQIVKSGTVQRASRLTAAPRLQQTIGKVGQSNSRPTGSRRPRRVAIELEGTYVDDAHLGKVASRHQRTINMVGQSDGRSTGAHHRRQVSIGLEGTGVDDDDGEAVQFVAKATSRHQLKKGNVGQSNSRPTVARRPRPVSIELEGTDDDDGDDGEAVQLVGKAASRHQLETGTVGQSNSRPTVTLHRRQVSIEPEVTYDEDSHLVGSQSFMETDESGLSFLSRSAAGDVTENGREGFANGARFVNSGDGLTGQSDHVGIPTLTMALGGHLPLAVKDKICKGDFVDFSNLLDSEALTAAPIPPWVVTQSGLLALQSPKQKKLETIEQWTDAFLVFMAVFCICHPEKAQDLLKYASVVREAAKKFSVQGALRYDEQFRKRQAIFPDRCWATIDGELWYTVLIPYGARDARLNAGSTRDLITPRAQAGTNYQRPRLFRQSGICFAFNNQEGCRNFRCRFFHACIKCRCQTHGAADCTRNAGPEKR